MKKTTLIAAFSLFVVMAIAVSCGGKSSVDAALSQIEKAMEKVEKNKTSMTKADWEALSKELEQPAKALNEALEDKEVGALKKIKIGAVMLRYATVVGEAALHTVSDSLKVKTDGIQPADPTATNPLQKALDSDELKKAIQELQKAAEKIK